MGAPNQSSAAHPVKRREVVFYVYGCAAAPRRRRKASVGAPLPRPAAALEAGSSCRWIEEQGVAALVSPLPAAVYEEAPLARHMENVAWLAERVERHNRVLLEAMAHTPVAPCRFGVLLRKPEGVVGMLRRLRTPLLKTLKRLGDGREWSVKAFAISPPARPGPGRGSPAEPARAATGGKAYLLARAQERAAQREATARARGRAGRLLALLARLARDVVPLPARAMKGQAEPFLNLACLVRRRDTRRWLRRLQAMAQREQNNSLRLAWSGPWPPYSFVAELSDPAACGRGADDDVGKRPQARSSGRR